MKAANMRQKWNDCSNWASKHIASASTYIQQHPYTTVALGSTLGDACYIGFALHSGHGLSVPQLATSLIAGAGQIVALAYGDKNLSNIDHESGVLTKVIWNMRKGAQKATDFVLCNRQISKPAAWACGLLALNGAGMLADVALETLPHVDLEALKQGAITLSETIKHGSLPTVNTALENLNRFDFTSLSQGVTNITDILKSNAFSTVEKTGLGAAITTGCICFTAAELLPEQHTKRSSLFSRGRTSFKFALAMNACLTASTLNPFTGLAFVCFGVVTHARAFIGRPSPAAAQPT